MSFSPQGGNELCGACDDAPEDAERKGLGTPATRAGMIEKLVETGFVERQKAKKNTNLIVSLQEVREYLSADETDLNALTTSAIEKLEKISDAEYEALDLFPDFDE